MNFFGQSFQVVIPYLLILIWTGVAIYVLVKGFLLKKKVNPYLIEAVPSVFTTLGVLGTFLGIAVGLWDFDVDNITESIPSLLGGLKVAFYSSIIGIGLSLIFARIFDWLVHKHESSSGHQNQELDALNQLISILKEEKEMQSTQHQELLDQFQNLNKGLSGDSPDSLSTHLVKMRNQLRDHHKAEMVVGETSQSLLASVSDALGGDGETSLLTQFVKMRQEMHDLNHEQIEALGAHQSILQTSEGHLQYLSNSLGGDSDQSLLVQFQDLRTQHLNMSQAAIGAIQELNGSVDSNHQESLGQLQNLADKFGEATFDALVEAFKGAIEGMNQKLAELLDRLVKKNFEELNQSVKNLNTWQQENKEHIKKLTDQFKDVSDNLQSSAISIKDIATNTDKLTNSNSVLRKMIEELESVLAEDSRFVKGTKTLTDATEKFSETTKTLETAGKDFGEWAGEQKKMVEKIKDLVDALEEIEQLRDDSSQFWDDIKEKMEDGIEVLENGNKELLREVESLDQAFHKRLEDSFVNLDKILQSMVTGYATQTESVIATLSNGKL